MIEEGHIVVEEPQEPLNPEVATPAPPELSPSSDSIPPGLPSDAPVTSRSATVEPPRADLVVPRPAPGVPTKFCFACGTQLDARAEICPRCGVRQTPPPGLVPDAALGPSRVAAALLGILLGTFGVHKFYLGKVAQGVLYLIFFWTFIPSIVGFIEGIWYLTMSDVEFQARFPQRP